MRSPKPKNTRGLENGPKPRNTEDWESAAQNQGTQSIGRVRPKTKEHKGLVERGQKPRNTKDWEKSILKITGKTLA